jgi:hypothetical protein
MGLKDDGGEFVKRLNFMVVFLSMGSSIAFANPILQCRYDESWNELSVHTSHAMINLSLRTVQILRPTHMPAPTHIPGQELACDDANNCRDDRGNSASISDYQQGSKLVVTLIGQDPFTLYCK